MTLRFERAALAGVAALVAVLVGVAATSPLEKKTSVPKASLRLAVSLLVPQKPVSRMPVAGPVAGQAVGHVKPTGAPTATARAVAAATTDARAADSDALGMDTLTGVVSVRAVQPHFSARLLRTADALSEAFHRLQYDLGRVGTGEARVPRLYLSSLPADMKDIREAEIRKSLFFKTVLPLVLQVNEEILADRRRLWRLHAEKQMGRRLGPVDRLWLMVMGERYGARRNVIDTLLRRVDVIPPSLALAQAAEESGWGTSRFAREGNAVFGQWTFSESNSLMPALRDSDKSHKIKAFPSLIESVRAYARNLNTHGAYRRMRSVRASMRLQGAPVEGNVLADYLESYSARGVEYIGAIRTIIQANDLDRLDDARLHQGQPAKRSLI